MKNRPPVQLLFLTLFVLCIIPSCHDVTSREEDPIKVIEKVEQSDTEIEDLYPAYLRTEYDKTITDVKAISDSSCCIILYATDLHFSYPGSGYAEKALLPPIVNLFLSMKRAEADLHPDLIVLGGDYIQLPLSKEGQTKEMGFQNLDYFNSWMNQFESPKFLLIGNHEENYTGDGTGYGMTTEEFYDYTQKRYIDGHSMNEVGQSHQLVYLDDNRLKIRFLFLSTPSPSYSPLKEEMDTLLHHTPNDYSVVVFNHYAGRDYDGQEPQPYQPVREAMEWIKASGADLIGWIGGHNHADMCYVWDGMVALTCLQSGLWTPGLSQDNVRYEHQLKHKDEIALSVLVINKKTGKIHIKRMGLGHDREINYNNLSGEVGLVKYTE